MARRAAPSINVPIRRSNSPCCYFMHETTPDKLLLEAVAQGLAVIGDLDDDVPF